MDEFSKFQLKEYENISQAHFKTNEVMSAFYRYYILITAVPITSIALAVANFSAAEYSAEEKIIGQITFGIFVTLICMMSIAILVYIEGLRLDSVLYARTVNSIRNHFFRPELSRRYTFGLPVLPTDRNFPNYKYSGAHRVIYLSCATLNSTYGAGAAFLFLYDVFKNEFFFSYSVLHFPAPFIVAIALLFGQVWWHHRLVSNKEDKGF